MARGEPVRLAGTGGLVAPLKHHHQPIQNELVLVG
jgi:hypothetical protein